MPETEELTEPKKQTESARNSRPKRSARRKRNKSGHGRGGRPTATLSFPKHAVSKCVRIPQAILDQNAGNQCTDKEATKFAGMAYTGQLGVEISSGIKYGLLERPSPGHVKPTDLTRRIVRPQKATDKRDAMREAVLNAPGISDAYKHYRGEHLPDLPFLKNTVRDTFHIPEDKADEFVTVFIETLKDAELLEDVGGKQRVLDVTHTADVEGTSASADERNGNPRRSMESSSALIAAICRIPSSVSGVERSRFRSGRTVSGTAASSERAPAIKASTSDCGVGQVESARTSASWTGR